jgi:hypothetical protein
VQGDLLPLTTSAAGLAVAPRRKMWRAQQLLARGRRSVDGGDVWLQGMVARHGRPTATRSAVATTGAHEDGRWAGSG